MATRSVGIPREPNFVQWYSLDEAQPRVFTRGERHRQPRPRELQVLYRAAGLVWTPGRHHALLPAVRLGAPEPDGPGSGPQATIEPPGETDTELRGPGYWTTCTLRQNDDEVSFMKTMCSLAVTSLLLSIVKAMLLMLPAIRDLMVVAPRYTLTTAQSFANPYLA